MFLNYQIFACRHSKAGDPFTPHSPRPEWNTWWLRCDGKILRERQGGVPQPGDAIPRGTAL